MMWEQYRKTFLLTQCFIAFICGVLLIIGVNFRGLLIPLVVMEVGGIFGARWAVRLKGSANNGGLLPPLTRR